MPATYEELLAETVPARIENDGEYERIAARLGGLVRPGRKRSVEETRLMKLLGLLVEDYDRRHGMPPDNSTPAEFLQFLVDHSGKASSDLLPVFGQRSHVHEALRGKRPISLVQARKLASLFNVQPGLFI